MKKRIASFVLLMLCAAIALTGCSPKNISEAKAKEAGLALINRAFDTNQTEAVATLKKVSEEAAKAPTKKQKSDNVSSDFYTVSVKDGSTGKEIYSALVNAKTGFAYEAGCSDQMLTQITEDQMKQLDELSNLPLIDAKVTEAIDKTKPQLVVSDWVQAHMQPDVKLDMVVQGGMEADPDVTRQIYITYQAVFADGAVYSISLVWPTMQIQRVCILSQSVQ